MEEDEREGGAPLCQARGECKYLQNPVAAHHGLSGVPLHYRDASGLSAFLVQAQRVRNLSPLTDQGPTLQALGWMDWETDLEPEEYQELLDIWHTTHLLKWLKRRRQ